MGKRWRVWNIAPNASEFGQVRNDGLFSGQGYCPCEFRERRYNRGGR